jgi:copper chaperone
MTETIELTVTGMKCGGCENTVREKLQTVAGISSVKPDFKNNQVIIEFDAELVTVDAIKNVITQAGFTVE